MATEPVLKGSSFLGLLEALRATWGQEGFTAVTARLSPEAKKFCEPGSVFARTWVPERFAAEIVRGTFEGPANRDLDEFYRWAQQVMDLGFGRIHRFLLRLSGPGRILSQAPRIWGEEHSHGKLETKVEGNAATIVLSDFPPISDEMMAHAYCATLRAVVVLTGAKDVTARFEMSAPTTMVIQMTWA